MLLVAAIGKISGYDVCEQVVDVTLHKYYFSGIMQPLDIADQFIGGDYFDNKSYQGGY